MCAAGLCVWASLTQNMYGVLWTYAIGRVVFYFWGTLGSVALLAALVLTVSFVMVGAHRHVHLPTTCLTHTPQ